MLDTANLAGFDRLEPLRVAWYLLPVAYVSCLIAVVLDKPRIAAAIQIVLSLPVLAFAVGVLITGFGQWGAGAATFLSFSSIVFCVVLTVRASLVTKHEGQLWQ